MTFNPATLQALGAYWTAQGGVNLGVVGNAAHTSGYHLGRDRIYDGSGPGLGDDDYSVQLPRDKAGLTNAASAIDLGRRNGSLAQLRTFSRWLVAQCQADEPGTEDVREVIYSPDGVKVQRYSGVDGAIHTGPGNGDASHTGHSHISFFRDSQARDKVGLFRPYFEETSMGAKVDLTGTVLGLATFPAGTKVIRVSDAKTRTFSPATTKRAVYATGEVGGTAVYLVEWEREAYTIAQSRCTFEPRVTPSVEAAVTAERERIALAEAARLRSI